MIKKIAIGTVFTLFLIALVLGYQYLTPKSSSKRHPVQVIPSNAVMMIQSNTPLETWDKLASTSLIWEKLTEIPEFAEVQKQFDLIDTLLSKQSLMEDVLTKSSLYLSIHPSEKQYNYLLTAQLPYAVSASEVSFFLSSFSDEENEKTNQEGIYKLNLQGQEQVYYSGQKGLFFFSPSLDLVKKVEQNLSDTSTTSPFDGVMKTLGKDQEVNVLYNSQKLFPILQKSYGAILAEQLPGFGAIADWNGLDVHLRPNQIQLNGFSEVSDTNYTFLRSFKGQKPRKLRVTQVMPENVQSFVALGFSNFGQWLDKYRLNITQQLTDPLDELHEEIMNETGVDLENDFLQWVEHEICFSSVLQQGKSNQFVLLRSNNAQYVEEGLLKAFNTYKEEIEQYTKKELSDLNGLISPFAFPNYFKDLFPNYTIGFEANYFTRIGHYLVFSENEEALQRFEEDVILEKTLSENKHYQEYASDLSDESNMYYYIDIPKSVRLWEDFSLEETSQFIARNRQILSNFQALSFQWSNENDNLFFSNMNLKYNPLQKEETGSIWEFALGGKSLMKPFIAKNHYTKAHEIFVQDDQHTIYLISNTGKLIWKKELGEQIISDIHQIDAYKNGKLQLLFNTAKHVYLLDRNGNHTADYPIALPSETKVGLSVMDYKKNKEYRIIIPCVDGSVLNLTGKGGRVKGWETKAVNKGFRTPIRHIVVSGKDYLLGVTDSNEVIGMDRRGKKRLFLKGPFDLHPEMTFAVSVRKSLEKSYLIGINSKGDLSKLYLSNTLENIELPSEGNKKWLKLVDVNHDSQWEYVISDTTGVHIYDKDRIQLASYPVSTTSVQPFNVYKFDGKHWIGIAESIKNKIHLFDRTGNIQPTFPLRGAGQFSIADINRDAELEVVTVDNKGTLMVYKMK